MSNQDLYSVALQVIGILEALRVPYEIGGALASSLQGSPRSTLDVDLVADLKSEQAAELVKALGADFYAEEEAIRKALASQRSFNVIHLATMLKVDVFPLKSTPFARSSFARRRQVSFPVPSGRLVWVSSPEDIVLHKLAWFAAGGQVSERQWLDVLGVLRVHGPVLDRSYLTQWASPLGVSELLARALSEAGIAPAQP